jgi:hypothetical protein
MSQDSVRSQFVVHFPHRGREHNPGKAKRQPWNRGNHGRKFLKSSGRYVADDGSLSERHGLVFWGEWEAPSYIIKRWPPANSLPRFLQRPAWERRAAAGWRLNTDPWIFGDCFRYSNCRQLTRPALQRLTPGSLILFGSTMARQFAIDTVFVVKDSCRFSPGEPPESDEAFRVCTVDSLVTTGNRDDLFTLYRGATYEDPFNGMYSFVPCRRAHDPRKRFSRPPISLGRFVNPESWRAARLTQCSCADVRRQWESVCKQVLGAGCLLGVWFATPQRETVITDVGKHPAGGAKGCAGKIRRRPTSGCSR